MTTTATEVHDALISAGAPDDKAHRAAEVLANYDDRFNSLERKIDGVQTDLERKIDGVRTGLERQIDGVRTGLERQIDGVRTSLEARMTVTEGRVNLLAWMVGTNITLTLLVLGKLFLLPGR